MKYRTIVADPPWHYEFASLYPGQPAKTKPLSYPTMTVEEIAAFLDIVEQVSPGPYMEMFARRARFGWDYWGNESLGTADLAA